MYRQWCLEIHFVVYSWVISWVDNIPGYIIYGDIDSESSLASPFDQNPMLSELFLQLRYAILHLYTVRGFASWQYKESD